MTKTFPVRRVKLPLVLCALLACSVWTSLGQTVDHISEREIAKRQAAMPQGVDAVARGQQAMKEKNYTLAHDEFRVAVAYLPDAVVSGRAHDQAVQGFCESGVHLAEQRIAEGKYAEAEAICREILTDQYNPNCDEAAELLKHLQTPGYFNRTMGPKFIAKVHDVRQLLADAEGYYQSGRYDLALKKYDQVLALDPYNVAARRGQERLDNEKYHYAEEAYNETRGRALWQVEKGWEEPVRQYGQTVGPLADAFQKDATGTARISNKLNTIIIPRIEFRDASIREAIDFLRQQAAANDPAPEGRKGVDIVLRLTPSGGAPPPVAVQPAPMPAPAAANPQGPGGPDTTGGAAPVPAPAPVIAPAVVAVPAISPADARITITLNQIPLGEALRYIASQAGLKVKVEPYAVSIIPINELSADLLTKEYRVPPGFINSTVNSGASTLNAPVHTAGGAAGAGTAKDTQESTGGHQLVNREGAREFLESQGVPFPQGASANFLPQSSRLIVRNTEDNLELVDALVEQANVSGPKQVTIESKFVEITQTNTKELGVDWLLAPFNIPGNLAMAGGTSGNGTPVSPANFPFLNSMGQPVGTNPVTAGNRSGDFAVSQNAIDALLAGTTGTKNPAPGIFGISGTIGNATFQAVLRGLNQKKGVDLLSAPSVTTKSGQRAVIEIVREFRYPTQFQPPQIPQSVGNTNGSSGGSASIPVTPTTPTAFETRNTGVTLEVEPVVGPDGITIDLNLVPQVVEFEGFINYGSPILAPASTSVFAVVNPITAVEQFFSVTTPQSVLTPNIINQPIFNARKVTTSVSVWDGQTVVLGGLMSEDVQKTEDRTPIIGDIPLVGRLFRTNTDQHIKRNLIIFVTAHLINPGGQPVNLTEEDEEKEGTIEPPVLPEVPMYKK